MSDIAAFLAARVDEDEARIEARIEAEIARLAADGVHVTRQDLLTPAPHYNPEWPARPLREVAAKRAILAAYEAELTASSDEKRWCPDYEGYLLGTLKILATVYSDHPDYDQGWATDCSRT